MSQLCRSCVAVVSQLCCSCVVDIRSYDPRGPTRYCQSVYRALSGHLHGTNRALIGHQQGIDRAPTGRQRGIGIGTYDQFFSSITNTTGVQFSRERKKSDIGSKTNDIS